jgi:hypothetical protein
MNSFYPLDRLKLNQIIKKLTGSLRCPEATAYRRRMVSTCPSRSRSCMFLRGTRCMGRRWGPCSRHCTCNRFAQCSWWSRWLSQRGKPCTPGFLSRVCTFPPDSPGNRYCRNPFGRDRKESYQAAEAGGFPRGGRSS